MLPLYVDINPNWDASTTLSKDKVEYCTHAIPTSFDEELIDLSNFNNDFISVFTNFSLEQEIRLEYIDHSSYLSGDFDVISKFHFKSTKTIKARIKRSNFEPSVVID